MVHFLELAGTVLALCLFSAVYQSIAVRFRFHKAVRQYGCKPPRRYPNKDPFLGVDLFSLIRKADKRGHQSRAHADLHKKYGGTFEMKALGRAQIQTAQPENVRAVAATKFDDFGVGPRRGKVGAPFMDRGIFTEDGEFWKHSRALIRPTFSRNEIADLANFERHVSRFLTLIPTDSSTIDLQPLAKRLFLDTSTEFLFGQSVESLLPQTPFDTAEFMKAFDYSLLGLVFRIMAGPLRFLLVLDPTWRKAYTKVHAFVDKHVAIAIDRQRRLAVAETGKSGNSNPREKYILLHQMAMETQDPYDLRSQILNVFFPARDTAANAFGNAMFQLARHPRVWEELRDEVLVIGSQPLTFELLKSLKITRAIINETLRLHLPASRVVRTALRDTVLPVGGGPDGRSPLFMPKGQNIDVDLYSLQRDPQIWGADAEEFKPGRWGEGRPLWEANWQYAPFFGGMRMCPAQNQVITQVSYLLVRMAQTFRAVENRDSVWEYEEEIKLTAQSRNGVKIALIPA